jgi:small conductance mechanosensitive channel
MPRRSTPNAFRNYALALRAQTIEAGRRARRELMLLIPLLVAIALAYAFRDQLFGTDQPVRLATAGALILIGWAFARSLGKALEPQLVNRLDPGSAGVVGFLVRFLALLAIVLVSLRIAGVELGAVAVGASFTAVIIGLAAQQTVGNILAGFVLISTHPFQVGDRVRFSGFGMDVEGTVAAHGLLHLTLTDGDDVVRIPNNTALTMSIRPLRQPAAVDMRARLPLGSDPVEIEARVSGGITVPTKDTPHIALEEFDGDAIVVRIRATPADHDQGGRLASEVLRTVTDLHEASTAPRPRRDHWEGDAARTEPERSRAGEPARTSRLRPETAGGTGNNSGNNSSETEPISDTGSVPEQA